MRTSLIGLGCVLVGCGGIAPMSGDYTGTTTLVADTCGIDEDTEVGDSQDFETTIVFNEDGSVVFDDDDDLDCTADGAIVTCTLTDVSSTDEADYTITQILALEIVWDTNTSFTGSQTVSISCEGADCSVLEDNGFSFPCSSDYDLAGAMAEDAAE